MILNTRRRQSSLNSSAWQIVLRQSSGKVVLYHPASNRLLVQTSVDPFQELEDSNVSDDNDNVGDGDQSSQILSEELYRPVDDDEREESESDNLQLYPPHANNLMLQPQEKFCPMCLRRLDFRTQNLDLSRPDPDPQSSSQPLGVIEPSTRAPRRALPAPSLGAENEQFSSSCDSSSRTVTKHSYFRLLSSTSRASTPLPSRAITPTLPSVLPRNSSSNSLSESLRPSPEKKDQPRIYEEEEAEEQLGDEKRVDGYYERFFVEEMKLGRGQKGSVFLCTHVLDGNALGHYAIKKIAVGQSSPELFNVLREVKWLESLRHRNITQYHHSWIEKAQLTRFGPRVPVLYILMDYANGGSLEHYISLRKGIKSPRRRSSSYPRSTPENDEDSEKRKREKELFRRRRKLNSVFIENQTYPTSRALDSSEVTLLSRPAEAPKSHPNPSFEMAVHLFGLEEILNIFEDTCRGLGFLHSKGILHQDLKSENVLLHWESEDSMIPTALISDFGSSVAQSDNWRRERTGRTGTLDWVPPESLKKDPRTGKLFEVTQKGDMWQLGLVLHFLCFFRLPYTESEDIDKLKDEIKRYPGFSAHDILGRWARKQSHSELLLNRSDLPHSLLQLLSSLLSLEPSRRPSCDLILSSLASIRDSTSAPPTRKSFFNSGSSPISTMKPGGSGSRERAIISENSGQSRVSSQKLQSALVQRKKIFETVPLSRSRSLAEQNSRITQDSKAKVWDSSSRGGSKGYLLSSPLLRKWLAYFSRSFPSTRLVPVLFALEIALKMAFFIRFGGQSFCSPSNMIFMTAFNALELVVCDWRLSFGISLVECIFVLLG